MLAATKPGESDMELSENEEMIEELEDCGERGGQEAEQDSGVERSGQDRASPVQQAIEAGM